MPAVEVRAMGDVAPAEELESLASHDDDQYDQPTPLGLLSGATTRSKPVIVIIKRCLCSPPRKRRHAQWHGVARPLSAFGSQPIFDID